MLFPNRILLSQCTFWCSVLSDPFKRAPSGRVCLYGLNAPSGAQCFPTQTRCMHTTRPMSGLNAPSGAQCFPTVAPRLLSTQLLHASQCTFWRSVLSDRSRSASRSASSLSQVSMHLLALSAFRHQGRWPSTRWPTASQCTFWCSVLSDGFQH